MRGGWHPWRRWPVLLGLLFGVLLASNAAGAPTFPPLTGRVVDAAGILSPSTQERLTSMLAQHERETGNQVVIVTLKSLQGYAIEDYGYQLGRYWGIGQKGHDNGALLIIAPNEHKVRIEVGYGLEGRLTDAQSKLIIENLILPQFRRGDFNAGVTAGATTLLRVLGGDASALPSQAEQPQQDDGGGGIGTIFVILILWIVFGRFLWPLFLFGGFGGRGGFGGGFGGGGFSGGGFSGGGFSGGGGSFGGGGASGSW